MMPSWQCRLSLPCEFYIYGWKFSVSINCWLHVVISHSKCAAALSIQQCETGEFHGSGKQVHVARFCAFSSIAVVTCSKCNMHAVFMDSSCHPFHILKVYEKHLCPTWAAPVIVPTNQSLTLDQKICHICRKEVLLHSAVSLS